MSIKKLVVSGVKWVAFANIFRQLMTFISTVIIVRLLTPDDFGLFAILMVFVGFFNMLIGMGSSSAIVQHESPSKKMLSSIFYFNIFVGFLFYFIMIMISGYISILFEKPEIEELLNLISLTFVIASFTALHQALFMKEIDFKTLSIIETLSTFISFSAGIYAAIEGLGVYSLIIRVLLGSALLSIMLWIVSSWKPICFFSFSEIKKIFNFASYLTAFSFVNYFSRNSDNFLIGKFLGTSSLGVYNVAYSIMLYPLQNISSVIIKVIFPAFSKIQNDNVKFKNAYLKVIFFIALISFPLMAGLMATSEVLVSIVFGDKWQGLASILFILAPIGMMQSLITTTGSIYLAKNKVQIMFKTGLINAIVMIISFIIGIPFGIKGVAIAYLTANIIMFYPMLSIAWNQIELSFKEGFFKILPILLISIVMYLCLLMLNTTFDNYLKNEVLKLLLSIIIGAILYLSLIKLKYGNLSLIINELRNK